MGNSHHEDLGASPKGDFYFKTEFYRSLKNEIIDDESYESVKKFWKLIQLNKLSELSEIYNFQNTTILCKISENRAIEMMQKVPYNPCKFTSASLLIQFIVHFIVHCIHIFLSKAIIALPTQAEIVNLFEQTLIGRLSCVNSRLEFDSKLLLPKNSDGKPTENLKIIYKIGNKDKRIVTKNSDGKPTENLKIIYKIANEDKRIVTKILKIDENN